MRFLFLILTYLIFTYGITAQNKNLKKYSYTELFELIEQEKDSIFKLSDAIIYLNKETDSLYRIIENAEHETKADSLYETIPTKIILDNIVFQDGAINNKKFLKDVSLTNCFNTTICYSYFSEDLTIFQNENRENETRTLISGNIFFNELGIYTSNNIKATTVLVYNNDFYNNAELDKNDTNFFNYCNVWFNILPTDYGVFQFLFNRGHKNTYFNIIGSKSTKVDLFDNSLEKSERLDINDLNKSTLNLGGSLPKELYINFDRKSTYDYSSIIDKIAPIDYWGKDSNAIRNNWPTENYIFYHIYIKNLNNLLENFKAKRETQAQNYVYVQLKKVETERFKYLFEQDKTFDNLFQWQINRFMGSFSNYGTKPSKAITTSVYVILLFALFYFLFPNDWDSNGKNRLMNRYAFFLKYLNLDSGMHDIYMSEKKDKLLEFDEFKKVLENSKHSIPKFFTTTALPLYRWSVLGTKFTSNALKRVDILKGSWQDVPKKKRWWKGLLIALAFIIAALFDIFIKFLNSLMLSVNTFSTLGFGDIPIKGFPRYLAIIEGFIGWFMLTIFSVSLISQLLN